MTTDHAKLDKAAGSALSSRFFWGAGAAAGTALALASLTMAATPCLQNQAGKSVADTTRKGEYKVQQQNLGWLQVSELGAGCMSISANYGAAADKAQGIRFIHEAGEKGVTFFETADTTANL